MSQTTWPSRLERSLKVKVTFHVTVDKKLADWVDGKVEEKRFASRSHAVDVALMELKRKETVKL